MFNLIKNATEAMISHKDRERVLQLRSKTGEDSSVMVTIEDTGPGIDQDDAERIFETFYTTKANGTGLGLAICQSIIQAHGGRLWASPGELSGTAFHFVLPTSAVRADA
jgi:signal transduction histidine kinase